MPGDNPNQLEHVLNSADVYNPASGKWTLTGAMVVPRTGHTATLLPNGQVLVAGGIPSIDSIYPSPMANAELYNPATNRWTATQSMNDNRFAFTATLLKNGLVLVAGGMAQLNYNGYLGEGSTWRTELYDPSRQKWLAGPHMDIPRDSGDATLLNDGTVLIDGGESVYQSTSCAMPYQCPFGNPAVLSDTYTP
jgi:hypothetical protein